MLDQPDIVLDPSSLDFGQAGLNGYLLGNISARNLGDVDLLIKSVAVPDPLESPFSFRFGPYSDVVISPGGFLAMQMRFDALSMGLFSDTFSVTSNDPDTPVLIAQVMAEALDYPDADTDSIPDTQDNCQNYPNTSQKDRNVDGLGDACDLDFNDDCAVNFFDLAMMKRTFFTVGPDVLTDVTGDGAVMFLDLGTLKSGFFQVPGPSALPNICDGGRVHCTDVACSGEASCSAGKSIVLDASIGLGASTNTLTVVARCDGIDVGQPLNVSDPGAGQRNIVQQAGSAPADGTLTCALLSLDQAPLESEVFFSCYAQP